MLGDHLCEGQCPPSLGSDVDEKRAWACVVERRGIGGFRRARGAARSQASPPQETRPSGAVAPLKAACFSRPTQPKDGVAVEQIVPRQPQRRAAERTRLERANLSKCSDSAK